MRILRIVGAVIVGYLATLVLVTLVQETWLGGVSWMGSSNTTIFFAAVFTILSTIVAGALATLVGGKSSTIPIVIISLLIALETFGMVVTGRIRKPMWFDLTGAASHIVGFVIGWALIDWARRQKHGDLESIQTP